MHKLFSISIFFFLIINKYLFSQELEIGKWRDHFPYTKAIAVADAGDIVYCAAENAIIKLNKQEKSIERISRIDGLAETEISDIAYSDKSSALVIAYKNSNIDIIKNNQIINVSDIKRSNIIGNKTINKIYIDENKAYLACGFGIVVLDTDRSEIRETYLIGQNGSNVNVLDITISSGYIFAATDEGIYKASTNAPNLTNFNEWYKDTNIPTGIYNTIAQINNKIYVNKYSQIFNSDSLFVYDGYNWNYNNFTQNQTTFRIKNAKNHLIFSYFDNVDVYDENMNLKYHIYNYFLNNINPQPLFAIIDNDNNVWIADHNQFLIKWDKNGYAERFLPNGPLSIRSFHLSMDNYGTLWLAPGSYLSNRSNLYFGDGISYFKNGFWETISNSEIPQFDTLFDKVFVNPDPNNPQRVFVSSWGRGLIEIENKQLKNIYNEKNSTLLNLNIPGYYWVGSACSQFDKNGILWTTSNGTNNHLNLMDKEGNWKTFSLSAATSNIAPGIFIIDKNNNFWIQNHRKGIIVFNHNNTFDDTSDDKIIWLNNQSGSGNLPSLDVSCIVEDRQGQIWIGTEKGVAVIYNPSGIFNGNVDAQQIKLEQDGQIQILLESERVTAIAVDGANRKWLGTESGGVFLMSPEGTKQIKTFNKNNSPLPSNNILSIAVNGQNGEVFFATDKGLVSYKSDATDGQEFFKNVYAYPNPVREDYEGIIAIKGLVENVDVKITDISGKLVYSTKSLGGQAVWDGKTVFGEKVKSGVYMVYCSTEDGSKTHVTKILVIN
ncbi:MAG: two-component regulator propeller domain-containing protein [Bacteroidia bacterium]